MTPLAREARITLANRLARLKLMAYGKETYIRFQESPFWR